MHHRTQPLSILKAITATFLTVQKNKKINYIVSTNQCLTINRVKYFGNTNVNTVHSTKYTEMNGCMHRLGLGQKKMDGIKAA